IYVFYLILRRPPSSTLFPYTTLFRSLPFVQRVDGLDVVMLVHEQRRPALVDDHLAEDDVRSAIRRIFARLETVLGQETPDEGSGLRLGPLVRRDRGKSNVLLENLQGLPRVRFNTGQDIRERQSTHRLREGRPAIRTRRVRGCYGATAACGSPPNRAKGISPRTGCASRRDYGTPEGCACHRDVCDHHVARRRPPGPDRHVVGRRRR